jgi:hypothetical protein
LNKELLNENLNQILEGLKTVINTANAELPAILEEIVRWGIIKYSASSLIWLVCLLLFVGAIILFIKNDCRDDSDDSFAAFSALMSLVSLIVFIYNFIKLLFAYTSPKLYIIHYIKDLI